MGWNIVRTQQFCRNERVHLDNGGVDGTIGFVGVGHIYVAK
jgi:hypothetical protein